jgi:hypothetical protein
VSRWHLVAGRVADDLAYGAGVYAGCVKHRTVRPLRVDVRHRTADAKRGTDG